MFEEAYLQSVKKQFSQLRFISEKAMEQVPDQKLNWKYNTESNSISTIVKHLSGNMQSRFTEFLTSDGEKKWRNRDAEFDDKPISRESLNNLWSLGWECFFAAINILTTDDLSRQVLIRNEKLSVMEAINRQMTHVAGHVGQIIFLSKMIADIQWETLSIPRNGSNAFNAQKGI